ncbi:helix-turn-helix domain-containing protein [Mannheimia haemolytica]|uniref:helix-turn-helix domain-containing protein n=1 Tax=Mannheimia haemolytica TaxID=75985 RepID=UPI001AD9E66A|nr:helix-turn-helix domain-containing protein [Mannheimia haemolytica]UQX70291.1 helix-turn-helix domain-containing protein [Mannheimia haemolytica]HDL1261429.1 helix-turn-helix domain-containing protein [Mannheimia haemolytica]
MATLYEDLLEGLTAMKEHLEGKRTLRTETLLRPEPLQISADEVKAIRAKLNLSQAVFAKRLRTSVKTYQGWEQGKSTPNPQATILLRLVEQSPQVFEQIARL